MPRQIFKNRIIAAAGPLPGQLTAENLKRWTEIRKGKFSEDFDEDVTHLLCTREQFKKRVPRVKEALKRGKRFHIIHYDWFEFSTVKNKREPEREYSMRNILAKQNAAKRELARIEKGKRDGEKFVNTNYFHLYIDREFFAYQIDINREDEATGEIGQRYTLSLWESDALPHLYWFTAKFLKRKGDSQPTYYRPSPHSGKWRTEMDHFMDFFQKKTGIAWEDRVLKEKTMPPEFFQYTPPKGGKPVGRRLRFDYEYCRQVNAELRGLPWPPPLPAVEVREHMELEAPIVILDGDTEAQDISGEEETGEGEQIKDGPGVVAVDDADMELDEDTQSLQEDGSGGEDSQMVDSEEDETETSRPHDSPMGSQETAPSSVSADALQEPECDLP